MLFPNISVVAAAENYGRFCLAPLEPGHGTMLANGLRRVLLSSIPGAAIVKLKIAGVTHEFSTIAGVREDVPALILNLKGVRMRCFAERPVTVALTRFGSGPVRAGDIDPPTSIEIVNPEHYLCTIDKPDTELAVDLTIVRGRGAMLAEQRETPLPIGEIAIDAIFSPVIRVNFIVESLPGTGVEQPEQVLLEIWTDGTIKPGDALSHAGEILAQHAQAIADWAAPFAVVAEQSSGSRVPAELFATPIDMLELPTRTYNALKRAGITDVGRLVEMDEKALAGVRNMGSKSVEEIRAALAAKGYLADLALTPA